MNLKESFPGLFFESRIVGTRTARFYSARYKIFEVCCACPAKRFYSVYSNNFLAHHCLSEI
jgi:hypothetical protein